jgi:hypothetical protein
MKLDLKPRHRNAGRPLSKSAPGFLQYCRGRPCVFADQGDCEGKTEAMHLDFAGDKGMGSKVSDRYALPCCSGHHRLQHSIGWTSFMRRMGVTREQMMLAAARLWNAWPSRLAWERKQAA